MATWLQDAGYHTAMIGKYLNRYVPERDGVPPGWDEWYVGGNAHPSYNYALNENGRTATYGDKPEDYLNDVLTDKAVQVIRHASAAAQPFFVYVLPYAAQPVDGGAQARGHVRRRGPAAFTRVRRGRRQRQARVHPDAPAAR